MSPPRVRRATATDAAVLVELRALMFASMQVAGVHEPGWQAAAVAWFERTLTDESAVAFVAEVDGRVAGAAVGTIRHEAPSPSSPAGVYGWVSNVATFPWARGQGVARACTAAVVQWFDEHTDAVQLDLSATGQGRGIYEALGFQEATWPAMRRQRAASGG